MRNDHLAAFSQFGVALGKFALNLHGTVDRIDNAIELRQDIIPRRIDNASSILLGKVIENGTVGFDCSDGSLFIVTHESAVALDVSAENGGELALKTLIGHRCTPNG